ncbi:MAG: DNA polymerase thumb domain-containing protein [Limnochordia bacterium]
MQKQPKQLARLGINTVEQLRQVPEEWLVRNFGKMGRQLFLLARGIDDTTCGMRVGGQVTGSRKHFPRRHFRLQGP